MVELYVALFLAESCRELFAFLLRNRGEVVTSVGKTHASAPRFNLSPKYVRSFSTLGWAAARSELAVLGVGGWLCGVGGVVCGVFGCGFAGNRGGHREES